MAFGPSPSSSWFMLISIGLMIFSRSWSPTSAAPQFPCYFIFGDSLVDSGNNNNLNTLAKANYFPYGIDFPQGVATGRFTNGRTIADVIGDLLGFDDYIPPFATAKSEDYIGGVNYASGSAGIRDETGSRLGENVNFNKQLLHHQTVLSQLSSSLGNQTAAEEHLGKCLYNVVIGSNDYINNYLNPEDYNTSSLYTPDQYAAALILQYSQQLTTLFNNGARKIALFGVGPLGCTPFEMSSVKSSTCVNEINVAVKLFNDRLKLLVDELNQELIGAKFIYIDSYTAQPGDPTTIGLQIFNKPCCGVSDIGQCIPGQRPCNVILRPVHLFWDGFHPSQTVNFNVGLLSYAKILTSYLFNSN